jgi:hypothetical protein
MLSMTPVLWAQARESGVFPADLPLPRRKNPSDRAREHDPFHIEKADRTLIGQEHRHLDRLLGDQAMHDAFRPAGGAGRPSLVLTRSPHEQ